MPYQSALSVVAPVRDGAADDLDRLLAEMGNGVANGEVIDFGALVEFHREKGALATVTAVQPPGRFGALALGDGSGMVGPHHASSIRSAARSRIATRS